MKTSVQASYLMTQISKYTYEKQIINPITHENNNNCPNVNEINLHG